jgi:hypothetical protein
MPRLETLRLYARGGREASAFLWGNPMEKPDAWSFPRVRRVVVLSALEYWNSTRGLRARVRPQLYEMVFHLPFGPNSSLGSGPFNFWANPLSNKVYRFTLIFTEAADDPVLRTQAPAMTAEEELSALMEEFDQLAAASQRLTIVGFELLAQRRRFDEVRTAETIEKLQDVATLLDQDSFIQSIGRETWDLYTREGGRVASTASGPNPAVGASVLVEAQ